MTPHQTHIPESPRSKTGILLGLGLLVLLSAGLLGGLLINRPDSATPSEDAERAAVRARNLAELRSADSNALTTYGWNDRPRGIVHIPITKAMELVLPALQQSSGKNEAQEVRP